MDQKIRGENRRKEKSIFQKLWYLNNWTLKQQRKQRKEIIKEIIGKHFSGQALSNQIEGAHKILCKMNNKKPTKALCFEISEDSRDKERNQNTQKEKTNMSYAKAKKSEPQQAS